MALTTVPVELANLDGAVTVNESSADVDFRIESNGLSHALFVDGGNDKVIINHTTNVGQAGVAPMFQIHGTGSATSSISATRNSNDTGGPYLILSKSRGTSTGAVTVVQDDDILGQIMFAGADGGDLAPVGASIQSFVDGTPGTDDMPGRLVFSTTADGAQTATERMRIDNAGKVGIGVAPSSNLHVKGTGETQIYIDAAASNNPGIRFLENGTSKWTIGNDQSNDSLFFYDFGSSATRMVIDSTGRVGINDTSPFAKLHVEDTSWSSGSPYGAVAYIQGGDVNDLNWGHLLISQSGTTTDTGGRISLGANGENPIAGIRAKYKGATYGDLAFLTRPSGGTSAERLVIDSSGRVIIGGSATIQDGYSTPGAHSAENNYYSKLWIQGNTYSTSGDGRLTLASGTAWPSTGTQIGSIWFSTSWGGDHASIRAVTNGGTGNGDYPASIHFDTTPDGGSSPSERMIIRMDGGIAIPASSSNSGANINGWLSHHTNNYFYMRGGTEGLYLMSGNAEASQGRIFVPGGGNAMTFVIQNTTRLSIAANGTFTGSASNDISDQRIKENIQTIPNALTTIKALQGRTFTWKEEAEQPPGVKYGFVAQEVESVVSDLVHDESGIIKINSDGSLNKNPSDEDEGEYAKSVQSTGVIPILVEAIKELSAEIESLKAEVKALKEA